MSALGTPPETPGQATLPCPRCGAPLRPDQDWCLACGAAVTTHVAGAPGWRTPVAIVGVVLLLLVAGLVVAFLELSDDADRVAQAPTPTPTTAAQATATPSPSPSPSPTATGSPTVGPSPAPGSTPSSGASPTPSPAPTVTPPTGGTSPGTAPPPSTTRPSPSPSPGSSGSTGTIASWPQGRNAWTVILKSASSRPEAEKRARELQAQGRSVGILNSSEYSSLRPGYWVVFSGQYERREDAQRAADGFKSSVPEAYARYVRK